MALGTRSPATSAPTATACSRPAPPPKPCWSGNGTGPDLLLVDLGLPDRDGISVVRRVRREATTPILVRLGAG